MRELDALITGRARTACMNRLLIFVALTLVSFGCADSRKDGASCFDSNECGGGSICVTTTTLGNLCVQTCSADDVFCEDGQVCASSDEDAELYVCLPGGEVALGSSCAADTECVLGAICNGSCARACDLSQTTGCTAPEVCTGTGTLGHCEAPSNP